MLIKGKKDIPKFKVNKAQAAYFISALFFGFILPLALPLAATAETSRAYDGCFERSGDATSALVWLKAPVCTITVNNSAAASATTIFTVRNLDPELYIVQNSVQESVTTTAGEGVLTFSIIVPPTSQEAVTLLPWDYDSNTTDFWFAAISDSQTQPGGDAPNPIFVNIMDELEMIYPRFVTISGDLIGGEDYDAEAHQAEYELFDEVLQEFAGSAFTIPGDHDAEDDLDAYYSAFFGERNFTFDYGNTRYVGVSSVDDSIEGKIPDDIFNWLSTTLQSNTKEHLIVLIHHPLVPPSWANSIGIYASQRQQLAELFTANGVELVIVGDVHGYDYSYIDSIDFPGLSGGFYQLVVGGTGGKITNYQGDYFFTLVHVSADGITPYRLDYSDVDFAIDYNNENDGTESALSFNLINNSNTTIPFMRAKVNLSPLAEKLYASTSYGDFLPFFSQDISGVQRAIIELTDIAPDELMTVAVKTRTKMLNGIANAVDTAGRITFIDLPVAANTETNLAVSAAENETTVEILAWDEERDERQWRETAVANSATTFTISNLTAARQYDLYINDKLTDRVATDADGVLEFSYDDSNSNREYRLQKGALMPQQFGVMPATGGGANLRLFSKNGRLHASFFTFDKSLNGGFTSQWLDLDDGGKLEIITVPDAGNISNIHAYKLDGTFLTGFYPFGSEFSGGVNLTAGDIDGDGDEEVIVTAQQQKKSVVKVYDYDAAAQAFTLLDSFRVFGREYLDGLEVASGDIDGDGDEEVMVGPRQHKEALRVYRWRPKRGDLRLWLAVKPFTLSDDAKKGITLAAGDVDFDGRDDLVVGSLTGGGLVRVYAYDATLQELEVISSRRVWAKGFAGGVNLVVGNINNDPRDEILIAPRTVVELLGHDSAAMATEGIITETATTTSISTSIPARLKVYQVQNGQRKLQRVAKIKPFGSAYNGGLNIGLADIDHDWKLEVMVARSQEGGNVRIYDKRRDNLKRIDAYKVYGDDFAGGFYLTTAL